MATAAPKKTYPMQGWWIICDMDGTITQSPSKAGGHYLALDQSACREPLRQWLLGGGNIAVVSTAGRRMVRQVYEQVKDCLKGPEGSSTEQQGQLVLCGFTGVAACSSVPPAPVISAGETSSFPIMKQIVGYRETVNSLVAPDAVVAAEAILQTVVRKGFRVMSETPDYLAVLSAKYRLPFQELLNQRLAVGAEDFDRTVLTSEAIRTHGVFLKETHDALLDCQAVGGLCQNDPETADIIAQFSMPGIPMKYFGLVFTPDVVDALAQLGFDCHAQPNSACIAPKGIDKATFIRYMMHEAHSESPRWHVETAKCVAMGDCPNSVDKPMTLFPEIRFVSVASLPREVPKEGSPLPQHVHFVGGEEDGSAAFVRHLTSLLVAAATSSTLPSSNQEDVIATAASRAAADMKIATSAAAPAAATTASSL